VDHGISPSRVVAVLGLVVGLLTGVGTIVGWVTSESFIDALGDVAAYAGAVYVGLAFIAIVVTARDETTWLQRLAPLAGVAALFFGVVLPWDRPWLWGCAALGLLTATVVGVPAVREQRERAKASKKVCPDCAETVKAEANVCHYCGYRFRPLAPGWKRYS
jgi:hypothetical protein